MLSRRLSLLVILSVLSVAFVADWTQCQSPGNVLAAQKDPSAQTLQTRSAYVLKVTTRLVTLDLIATDSHGNLVRDIKPEELQVYEEHDVRQKIEQFEFLDNSSRGESPIKPSTTAAGTYSNQISSGQLKIAPTVLLMDGLNTETIDQARGRMHMLKLLRTLPPDTPVAVLLLGRSLRLLQGFTTDRKLLFTAIDHALTTTTGKMLNPQDDPNSFSNAMADMGGQSAQYANLVSQIQEFELEEYQRTMDLQVDSTVDALISIGQYLSGTPGRKNLVWVSESFPISVLPDPGSGLYTFAGVRN